MNGTSEGIKELCALQSDHRVLSHWLSNEVIGVMQVMSDY